MKYVDIVEFHGHECPGLAIGYRMARAGLDALESTRAEDEELVAIVENDACGVDALQCLTGCTFGKGNLLFRDYGKQVYTLFSRTSGQGVRLVYHGKGADEKIREDRDALATWILSAPLEQMISVKAVHIPAPEPARIRDSIDCDACKESVMTSRVRKHNGKGLCIPCSEKR